MVLGSFYFKQEARRALRGNWQPALVVTFFSGIFLTLSSVLQALWVPDPVLYASYGLFERFWQELAAVSQAEWAGLIVVNFLSLLLSPALALGCNRYFLKLLDGKESGVREGLLGRMRIWPKALWLYVQMGVRVFLWSLLLVVPGILAAIRYSMAPYFMAQDPSISASEAIEQSKHAMKEMKLAYFSLIISFIGWSLLANVAQMFLMSFGVVIALVTLVAATLVLKFTRFGRNIYALGGNEMSAQLMGLPTKRTKILAYVVCGFCSALAGVVYSLIMLSGYPLHAVSMEMDAIASSVIGGTLMSGGVAFLPGTLLGVLIQGVIQTFITFQGTLSAWWTRIIIALLLCLFIVIQAVVSRSRQRLNSEH